MDRPSSPIRLVIADDHPIFRRGLRQLLDRQPDMEVVAEGNDFDSARRYVLGHKPDVLVVDLNMPGRPVLEGLPSLTVEFPQTRVVVLTMQDDPAYARRALSAGALGYVLKDAADHELVAAVRAAADGEPFLNPRLGATLAALPDDVTPGGLTNRELEVVRLLALGNTNAQIAGRLHLSARTVETHRANLQRKLDIHSRQGLTNFAFEHHLIDPAEAVAAG